MTAREPACHPVCRFYGEVGEIPTGRAMGDFRGGVPSTQGGYSHILAQSKKRRKPLQYLKKTDLRLRRFWCKKQPFAMVENQAGEKDGVAKAPRPISQRTATPTAQGLLELSLQKSRRGCKTTRKPVVGVMTMENCRNTKEKDSVVNGVVLQKRR